MIQDAEGPFEYPAPSEKPLAQRRSTPPAEPAATMLFELAADATTRSVNAAALSITGYSAVELIGHNWWLRVLREDEAADFLLELAEGEVAGQSQVWMTKDGRELLVELHTTSRRNSDGTREGLFGCAIWRGEILNPAPVTEEDRPAKRRRLERMLAEREEQLAKALELLPVGVSLLNRAGDMVLHNPAARRVLGLESGGDTGRNQLEPGNDYFAWARERVLRDGETVLNQEMVVENPNGEKKTLLAAVIPVRSAAGEVIGAVAMSEDISGRRKAESKTETAEARMRAFMDNTPAIVLIKDTDGRCLYANRAAEAFFGLSLAELTGKDQFARHPNHLAQKLRDNDLLVMETGRPHHFEEQVLNGEGQVRTSITAKFMMSAPPDDRLLAIVAIDVTENLQKERALQAIAAMTSALRSARGQKDMLPIILREVQELLQVEAVTLVLRDGDSGDTYIRAAGGTWSSAVGLKIPQGFTLVGQVMETGEPYVTSDLQNEPSLITSEMRGHLSAGAFVPLATQDHVVGALGVGRNSPFSESELSVLSAIGEIAASAVHRAALHEETELRLKRLTALREVDAAISGSQDLRATLGVLLESTLAQLGVDAATVLLLNGRTRGFTLAGSRGFTGRDLWNVHLDQEDGLPGRVVARGSRVKVKDLAAEICTPERTAIFRREGFQQYYGAPLVTKGQITGVLEVFHRGHLKANVEWLDFLDTLAGQAAIATENISLLEELQQSNIDLMLAYDSTIEGWSRALDLRDRETEGHSRRVTEGAMLMARAMDWTGEDLLHVRRGALLHDIGKMGVPDNILLKPGKLTDEEWVLMKRHPDYAYELLHPIVFLRPALDIPYCHHEKWDGTGYPRGLSGEKIPLAARIFAVVDVWDALRSDRPYRAGWSAEAVRKHIAAAAGTHFDPAVVDVFLTMDLESISGR